MSYPTVSVIIATYNRDEPLCSAISRVLGQDYPANVQLIVVDQSPIHGKEAAEFLRGRQQQMRYLRLTEPNLPKARNAGLAEAVGDLILFVDDDVVLPPHAVSRLASRFPECGARAVSGVVLSTRVPEASLRCYVQQCGPGVLEPNHDPIEVSHIDGSLICLPAEAVRLVRGFDEGFGRLTPTASGEDHDFCYRLRKAKVRLFIDPSLRVSHLDDVAGGCETRQIDPQFATRYQARAMAYMSLKWHGRLGVRGWARLVRGMVLNRYTLSRGLPYVRSRFLDARNAVREAESFILANKSESAASRATDVPYTSEVSQPKKVGI